MKKDVSSHDPRGLIYESYRIDGISSEECRSIFLDWALGQSLGFDVKAALTDLLSMYGDVHSDHPMTKILQDGLASGKVPRRRGGRAGRT